MITFEPTHCDGSDTQTGRWFIGHQQKSYGPFTWQRLVSLAVRGDLDPNVMLFKEGSNRSVRAGTLRTLLAGAPAVGAAPTIAGRKPAPAAARPVSAALERILPASATNSPEPSKERATKSAAPSDLQGLIDYINRLDAAIQSVATTPAPHGLLPPLNSRTDFVPAPAASVAVPVAPSPLPLPPAPPSPAVVASPPAERCAMPSLIEALVAASMIVLLTVAVVLGFFVIEWVKPHLTTDTIEPANIERAMNPGEPHQDSEQILNPERGAWAPIPSSR